jgi:uncharacterized damage-inducible protein DinB
MHALAQLAREFTYNAWANLETLRALANAGNPPERAREVMAHIAGAESLWLRRLGQPGPQLPVWPALSLPHVEQHLNELASVWGSYLASLSDGALLAEVSYVNSKKEAWANTVGDVLRHVLFHSAYHRGQIATVLGRAGQQAAYTDYIEWVRRGHASPPTDLA